MLFFTKPILLLIIFFIFANVFINFKEVFILFFSRLIKEMLTVVSYPFSFLIVLFLFVFVFIFFFNLCGLFPYVACWTAQIFVNLLLSFCLILGLTFMNLDKNGVNFFNLFIPEGVPELLKVPLFILEMVSYFIRILSLSIRLFSNMVAGHSLLHIIFDMSMRVHSSLEFFIFDVMLVLSVFSIGVVFIIFFFEVIVAFLQAYVFAVMFVIYANDLNIQH